MGMGAPKSSTGGEGELGPIADINVTPLVDVMLVLLIIFMVTAPLMMSQLPIQLPKTNPSQQEKKKDPTVVSVDQNGVYFLDEGYGAGPQQMDYTALQLKLREMAKKDSSDLIFVKGANHIAYGTVVDLIGMVGNSGFDKVSLQQQKPDGE